MAHGIKAGMAATFLVSVPKMCGKVVAKDVAIWTAAKKTLPMLALCHFNTLVSDEGSWSDERGGAYASSNPNTLFDWFVVMYFETAMVFS